MTVSVLDIVTTPTDSVAVVTGIVPHPHGEPQVFLRTLDTNKPLQTTQQMTTHGPYTVIGNWTNKKTREHVRDTYTVNVNPFTAVSNDTLPTY